jgi:pimeloyl-ACP methyl ester carboxylesterase
LRILQKTVLTGRPEQGLAAFVDFWSGAGTWNTCSSERQAALIADADRIVGNFTSIARENWPLSDCTKLCCPVMGVVGRASPALARHLTRLIIGAIPNARLMQITGAGHMLPMTHPEIVAKLLTHQFALSSAYKPTLTLAA